MVKKPASLSQLYGKKIKKSIQNLIPASDSPEGLKLNNIGL